MDGERMTRLMLAAGVIGPVLFVIVALVEGATRAGYSAWRHFVSQLSMSAQGWMQIVNFMVCGLLMLCFALGLRRALGPGRGMTWGPALLAVFGLGLIAAGVFVTDPALGYPPGARIGSPQTLHGTVHGLAGILSFGSLAAASFVLARRFAGDPEWRGWTAYSITTGAMVVVFLHRVERSRGSRRERHPPERAHRRAPAHRNCSWLGLGRPPRTPRDAAPTQT